MRLPKDSGQGSRAIAGRYAALLHYAITICLFGLALSVLVLDTLQWRWVPRMIWASAMLLWLARLTVSPRPRFYRTPIDFALIGFFILSLLSSIFSYDPDVSLRKMKVELFFTVVYLVAENVFSRRVLRLLMLTLIAGCLVSVFYTIKERIEGQGVKIQGLKAESPLYVAGFRDGDTLLNMDGKLLRSPDEIDRALAQSAPSAPPVRIIFYRFEWIYSYQVPRGSLLDGATPLERLGLGSWSRGRDWRAWGFYSDYTVYAEILQLIASLAAGLLIALPRKRTWLGASLAVAIAGFSVALLLTMVRGSWLGFLLSAFVMVLMGASRRAMLALMLGALLVTPLALYFLHAKRNVGFYDRKDGSITWREKVYREGVNLLVKQPRHLLVGVGIESINRRWREWGLFDNGRIPPSHLHSTPLSIAVERGLPTLIMWLILMLVYGRVLFNLARTNRVEGWVERGIVLGALGGLVGFFVSGIVNYNLGHWEVAIIFYFVMGLALVVERQVREKSAARFAFQ